MTVVDAAGIPRALFASGAGVRARLEEWDAAIRGPLAGARRIGVVALAPGSGATTLAHAVLRVVAPRRGGPVLAVDAVGERPDLAARLGVTEVAVADDARAAARTTAEAMTGLPVGVDGIRVLFPGRHAADAIGAWLDDAAPIARFFDVAVTDFGPRHPAVDLAAAAALCDVVCVVSPGDRAAAEVSRSIGSGIAALPERPRVVLALVDRARSARRAPAVVAAHAPFPVVRIPADRGLAAGRGAVSLRTRWALLELSAALVDAGGRPA